MKASELLEEILNRPAMYVGHASVPKIKAFIDGFRFADSSLTDPLYSGFTEWVAKRFSVTTAHNWANIIEFMGVSEAGAFELLKKLWTEYKAEYS